MDRIERDEADSSAVAELQHDLPASLKAETVAIYEPLRSRAGFAKRIADVERTDTLMLRLCGDLARAAPAARGTLIRQLRTAFEHHMHEDSCMFPVAMRELQFHVWEHMKHRFETGKRAALRASKGEPHATAGVDLIEALQSPPDQEAGSQIGECVKRLQRIESGHVLACRTAIDRSEKTSHRSLLGDIVEDHLHAERRLDELRTASIEEWSPKPSPSRGAWMRIVWSAAMGETSLLKAVAANERRSSRIYAQMLSRQDAARAIVEILARKAEEHVRSISTALTN